MSPQENLHQLLSDIKNTCQTYGRDPQKIKLLAVSKLQPSEKIVFLNDAGQVDFGENYVQELTKKMDALKEKNIRWHLIGHLQKNKIKYILGRCHLIHSVDSLELALQINKLAATKKITENILLEINLAKEETKTGFKKETLLQHWSEIAALPALKIHGLMTMPPLSNENPEDNRPYFRELKKLLAKLQETQTQHPLTELSMGTSHDYKVAIAEGATIIRVGTALFGERPQKTSF